MDLAWSVFCGMVIYEMNSPWMTRESWKRTFKKLW